MAVGDTSTPDDLTQMSLADLAKIEVTSVSKTSEVLQRAPSAIYVITHDDIMRSGVTSIPEALRLAPNLQVTQMSPATSGRRAVSAATRQRRTSPTSCWF